MRRILYLAQCLLILLIFLLQPFYALWWLLLWPWLFFCFYQLLRQWQHPIKARLLLLSEKGELKWWQDELPAGQLSAESLVSQLGIWLRWRDTEQQTQQLWLYRDNLSEEHFRSLARVCQTAKWQQQADSVNRR
ncbi:protein YgfX [Rheinheimera sp. 1928-s]|nr:protein YgfX [Rheinheimera sp. 1928-s]MDF3127014.1 protein YgfX [Rheinheimera sp. 1928-s]